MKSDETGRAFYKERNRLVKSVPSLPWRQGQRNGRGREEESENNGRGA